MVTTSVPFLLLPLKIIFLFHIKISEVHVHKNKLLEETINMEDIINTEEKRTLLLPREVRGKIAGTREV